MRTIFPGPDGKFRWTYEMSLYKNPTFLLMVIKIFFWIIFGIFVFSSLLQVGDRDFWFDGLLGQVKAFGIILGVMLALCVIGYLIYALMMGGKYVVRFEMDENGVSHTQSTAQAEKARKIGTATMAVGALAGKPGVVGIGMQSGARTSMTTDFERVKSVKAYKNRSVIKVNEVLSKNQVYCDGDDFDFILDYIQQRVAVLVPIRQAKLAAEKEKRRQEKAQRRQRGR